MKKWLVNCISEDGEFTIELVEAARVQTSQGCLYFLDDNNRETIIYSPAGWFNVRPFNE